MPPFQATFRGRDIFGYHVPRSGASYGSEFEWREAARWSLHTWEVFELLDGEEQSAIVAQYRVHHQLEAVIAHEQAREQRRQSTRGKRGRT